MNESKKESWDILTREPESPELLKALDNKKKEEERQKKGRKNMIISAVGVILYIAVMMYTEPSLYMFAVSAGTAIVTILFVRLCLDVHAIRKHMDKTE